MAGVLEMQHPVQHLELMNHICHIKEWIFKFNSINLTNVLLTRDTRNIDIKVSYQIGIPLIAIQMEQCTLSSNCMQPKVS